VQRAGAVQVDGRAVDGERAGKQAVQHGFPDLPGDRAVGQHGDQRLRSLRGLLAGCRHGEAGLARRIPRRFHGIVATHIEAGLHEIDRHGLAHVAQADECDGHGVCPPRRAPLMPARFVAYPIYARNGGSSARGLRGCTLALRCVSASRQELRPTPPVGAMLQSGGVAGLMGNFLLRLSSDFGSRESEWRLSPQLGHSMGGCACLNADAPEFSSWPRAASPFHQGGQQPPL